MLLSNVTQSSRKDKTVSVDIRRSWLKRHIITNKRDSIYLLQLSAKRLIEYVSKSFSVSTSEQLIAGMSDYYSVAERET